jgi:hypothetical protein
VLLNGFGYADLLVQSYELALFVIAEDRIFNGFDGRVTGGEIKSSLEQKRGKFAMELTVIVLKIH